MIRVRSLTARLLIAVVAPLIVSAVLIGVGGALATKNVVDYTSDRLLAGSVRAIAESVTVEDGKVWVNLPPWSLGLLDSPQRDSVYYNVRQAGRVLTGYVDLPAFDAEALAHDGPVFRTISYHSQLVRQAAQARTEPGASGPVVISVAQTLDSRLAVRKSLLADFGAVEAGLVILVAIFIWPAARWSLRPLKGLRRDLSERSISRELDFTPVAIADVPRELRHIVTAFNTVLAQLERSVDGVRRFTADASHQMRTPLAILKAQLKLLSLRRRSAQDRESLDYAVEAVDRMQRLIEQLLALARADAVEEDGHEVSNLSKIAYESVSRWRKRANDAEANLNFEGASDLPLVALSGPLVEQIVENLIDNAMRYGGGTVWVVVFQVDGYGVLAVRDDGEGLPASLRPFERFARGPDSSQLGSGLGLSIVKALADRCGGKVQVGRCSDSDLFSVEIFLPIASNLADLHAADLGADRRES